MLIPSIDLLGGRVVQLVQGERLALSTGDLDGWIERFAKFPAIQVVDLDRAKRTGDNAPLVASICRRLPCRVGGGVRTIADANALFETEARKVILGSALFRSGAVDAHFVRSMADAFGAGRLIAAVDARDGHVVVDGWRTSLPISPEAAVRHLESFVDEFLFTNVALEGLMHGIDRLAVQSVARATRKKVTAAGGVTTHEDVAWLESIGVDAVAGMAIYTGTLKI